MKLFADRRSWFDHELTCHRLEWCCRFCSHPAFANQEKLAAHIHARHSQLSSSAQLRVLLHASRQVVDRVPAADCLLCDWDSILKQKNTTASPNETLVVTLDQFCRHLGSHMEQLALFALPRYYKGHGAEGYSNEAAGSTAPSLDSLSWKSISGASETQDHAVPDLAEDQNLKPFKVAADLGTSESSPYAWSNVDLTRKPMKGYAGFSKGRIKWIGGASGQTCFSKGEIYIHGD